MRRALTAARPPDPKIITTFSKPKPARQAPPDTGRAVTPPNQRADTRTKRSELRSTRRKLNKTDFTQRGEPGVELLVEKRLKT